MESIRNKVQLIGNTGKDPILKEFDNGRKKTTISMATSQYYKDANGQFQTNTQWHNIIAWGAMAEALHNKVKKGDHLIIAGSIQYRSYEDNTGTTRYITEIVTNSFMKTTKDRANEDAIKMEKERLATAAI